MKILVTGSRGFIGSHLVRRLKQNFVNVEVVTDINRIKECSVVYHLAASVPFAGYEFEIGHMNSDLKDLDDLLILSEANKIKKFIFLSGANARYGTDLYSQTKVGAEYIIRMYKLNHTILRLPGVYGQGQRETGLIYELAKNSLTKDITKDIDNVYRNYIDINECIDILINAMTMPSGTYDIVGTKDLHKGILEYAKSLAPTIYFDFDGTLVNCKKRPPYKGRFVECLESVENDTLVDGVIPLLKSLKKKGYRLVVITKRKLQWLFLAQLANFKITKYFDEIINTNDLPKELFIKYYDNAMIVGDTEVDIDAGKIMKMKTVAVLGGFRTKKQLEALKPDFIIKDVTKLRECL